VSILKSSFINGIAAEVDYPTLNCSSVWKLQSAIGNRYQMVESITVGMDRCIPTGIVNLVYRSEKNLLEFTYSDPEGTPGSRALAVLEHKK
jgi:hypothetical protein